MPTISVIVPIYNTAAYLEKCINSLIHQSYHALQIILINDGSTDNSLIIAEQYAKQDSRIEVYSQTNQGLSSARNYGLSYAKGEYISFIDSDDFIDDNFYEIVMANMNDTTDYIQFGYTRITTEGDILYKKMPKHVYQFHSACMRLYRFDFIKKYSLHFSKGKIYEDVLFSIDLWEKQPRYKIIPFTGYNYTVNSQSTTATRNRAAEEELFAILNEKSKHSNSVCQKLLLLYTIIRLKLHFLRHE